MKRKQEIHKKSGRDPVQYMRVMMALYPEEVCNSIRDAMAKRGMTEQDILEAFRKRESLARVR